MPNLKETKRRATPRRPNHLAVALWIEAGPEAILLGSDLEETNDSKTGWSVIVESSERPEGSAGVFKVPHHGSATGHNDAIWDKMIAKGAYAILTPFVHAGTNLPTETDIGRIKSRTPLTYITSRFEARAPVRRDPVVERTVRETVGRIRTAEPKTGHIRLRKKYGAPAWSIELLRNASKL
jgi:hypothetical protein